MKRKKILSTLLILAIIIISATGCGHEHTFVDWKIIKEATCFEDGSKEGVCECGEKSTEIIKSEGHKFSEATYKSPKTCELCGETEGEPLGELIKKGDKRKGDDYEFKVESISYTSKIKEKHGIVTRIYGEAGKYYLVCKLKYKNLSTEEFDSLNDYRISEMQVKYMDEYDYEGTCRVLGGDIVSLASGNVYLCFAVPKEIEIDKDSSVVMSFKVYDDLYFIEVNKGKDKPKTTTDETKTNNQPQGLSDLKIGSSVSKEEKHSFSVKKAYFASKIREKHGKSTSTFGGDGSYYYVIQLDFKNLSTEDLTNFNYISRIPDIKLKYDNKYDYNGNALLLTGNIVPLSSGNLYIYFEVSKDIEKDGKPLVATFKIDDCEYTFIGR